LTKDTSDKAVLSAVKGVITELKVLSNLEQRKVGNIKDDIHREYVGYALERLVELVEEFEWVKESMENKKTASDVGFDNWCEAFNEYLNQLYDLGDSVVKPGSFSDQEKYIWIE